MGKSQGKNRGESVSQLYFHFQGLVLFSDPSHRWTSMHQNHNLPKAKHVLSYCSVEACTKSSRLLFHKVLQEKQIRWYSVIDFFKTFLNILVDQAINLLYIFLLWSRSQDIICQWLSHKVRLIINVRGFDKGIAPRCLTTGNIQEH